MFPEDLESLEARSDADRMAVVSPSVERRVLPAAARLEDVHDLRFAPEACQLEPAAADLAKRRHVRPDVVILLVAAVFEAEAGQDLIEDHDYAPLAPQRPQPSMVVRLRRSHA